VWRRVRIPRPVCLGVKHPSGTRDQFFFLEVFFRQLQVCCFVAPSLTRGRVCNLLYNCFWALPEQSLLDRSPAELRPYFTLLFEPPPAWRARFPYLYPPGTGWPSYTPGHWVPFLSPLTTRRDYGGSILPRLHTGQAVSCDRGHGSRGQW
jgi:hypothetical protein